MTWQHNAVGESGSTVTVTIRDLPDECPLCQTKGTFHPFNLFHNTKSTDEHQLEIVFRCPNSRCYEVFIGYYAAVGAGYFDFRRSAPRLYASRNFSETINRVSPSFQNIYNQSLKAENDELNQICGPGYRKALEFLIKDYLISLAKGEAEHEAIKSELLGACIANRIQSVNINSVAKRAVWLGNDETHYVRRWDQKDLQDLKKLIDLTVHWVEQEILTKELITDMPDSN